MTTFTPQEEKVYQVLSEILVNDFEIPADKIKPEARLYEDFDIDSIDAVDMIVQLKPHLGGRRISPGAPWATSSRSSHASLKSLPTGKPIKAHLQTCRHPDF